MNTLDYITPKSHFANPRPASVMVAWYCWLVPLASGLVALFGFWASAYSDFFVLLGALALLGGIAGAVAGLILVGLTYSFSARVEPETRSRLRRRASFALVGFLLNFLIAFGCIVILANVIDD